MGDFTKKKFLEFLFWMLLCVMMGMLIIFMTIEFQWHMKIRNIEWEYIESLGKYMDSVETDSLLDHSDQFIQSGGLHENR